jgi:hypothetical protein
MWVFRVHNTIAKEAGDFVTQQELITAYQKKGALILLVFVFVKAENVQKLRQ